MVEPEVVVKNADLPEEIQAFAIDVFKQALARHSLEREIAAHIKKEMDRVYGPTWHCIVGRNFGSYVSHEVNRFMYCYYGQIAILLFKSG